MRGTLALNGLIIIDYNYLCYIISINLIRHPGEYTLNNFPKIIKMFNRTVWTDAEISETYFQGGYKRINFFKFAETWRRSLLL